MTNDKIILRVFPNKTSATPDDENVRFGFPGMYDEADEIHISVAFKWHLKNADILARAWEAVAPVKIGGPATGDRGENFTAGQYLKRGYTITNSGCPNRCWFCEAGTREGNIRELPIVAGSNVIDNNILACSDIHIKNVFKMLAKQKPVEFTGGLEAARLQDWHIEELLKIKPKQMFFAYDEKKDYEPLVVAGNKLLNAGFTRKSHALRCYVLFGYEGDTPEKAHGRFVKTIIAGFMPMAMFYRQNQFTPITKEWHDLQWLYSRPAAMAKEYLSYE